MISQSAPKYSNNQKFCPVFDSVTKQRRFSPEWYWAKIWRFDVILMGFRLSLRSERLMRASHMQTLTAERSHCVDAAHVQLHGGKTPWHSFKSGSKPSALSCCVNQHLSVFTAPSLLSWPFLSVMVLDVSSGWHSSGLISGSAAGCLGCLVSEPCGVIPVVRGRISTNVRTCLPLKPDP